MNDNSKKSFFTKDFFIANRQSLRNAGKASLIVITANGMLQRNSDSTYPFRQDSTFWYLTGLEEPNAVLVITQDAEYIILPERGKYLEIFEGSVEKNEIIFRSGVKSVLSHQLGWKRLKKDIRASSRIATMLAPKAFIDIYGMYVNPARLQLIEQLKSITHTVELTDIRDDVMRMRCVKQSEEVAAIRAAIDLTSKTLDEVKKNIDQYQYEYEVNAVITQSFLHSNSGHAYGAIVASAKNATVLHYVANNDVLHEGQLLLLDVGAEVENYAADITRVYSVGVPTSRQKDVHQAVVQAQKEILKLIKPGISIKQLESKTSNIMESFLNDLSVLPHPIKKLRDYYPHAVSHFLGLDVHDVGDYHAPLAPGMVITVEPGIYIPEESIGVRIEDDVLITENGCEVLSSDLSQTLS